MLSQSSFFCDKRRWGMWRSANLRECARKDSAAYRTEGHRRAVSMDTSTETGVSPHLVEHAIFTSAQVRGSAGYHLVAKSAGISNEESRELSVWGPSHDSLIPGCPAGRSFNFHTLSSGRFCVSLTTKSGAEYSARGGLRIYTHSLVISASILRRFSNDPFRLFEAAMTSGILDELAPAEILSASRLLGRASSVDHDLLREQLDSIGPHSLAGALQTVIQSDLIAIQSASVELLMATLMTLLPPSCRCELSLSTGLRQSPRRPFRLTALDSSVAASHEIRKSHEIVNIDLVGTRTHQPELGPWTDFVLNILKRRQFERLAAIYKQIPAQTRLDRLDPTIDEIRRQGSRSIGEIV